MLRLIHCRPRCSQLCWSGTYDIDDLLTIALYDLLSTKLELGHQCIIIVSVLMLAAFSAPLILNLVGANNFVNSNLNVLSLLLELIWKYYRSYLTLRDLASMGVKRRRSESDVPNLPQTRHGTIEDTARREQSKRKWVDDLDIPSGDFFCKKPRYLSAQLADIEWTRGKRRVRPAQTSETHQYLYRWIPKRPPWYTARVRKSCALRVRRWYALKKYARFGDPRKRRVYYSKRQVQGLEKFLSAYDPRFNAIWIGTSEESSNVADAPAAAEPGQFVPSANSSYQPLMEGEDEEL